MRVERGRKKKLIVAFHFQFSDLAAWKCDDCRKSGLDKKRRCGFLPAEQVGAPRVVWVRGAAASHECPKSLITAQSVAYLERYAAWKTLGGMALEDLPARDVEAMMILEKELKAERENGQR